MKTISLKKVSAVAVASLGFGLLSVVPANAAAGDPKACTAWTVNTANKVTSVSLATVTATPTANAAVKVNMGGVLLTHGTNALLSNACSQQKFIGFLSEYPAGGYTNVSSVAATGAVAVTGATTDVTTDTTAVIFAQTTGTDASGTGGTVVSAANTTATAAAGLGAFTFTPAKAGTYVLKVFNDTGTLNATPDTTEAVQTISITVAADAVYSNTLSTAFITPGLGGTGTDYATTPAIATVDKPVFASATMAAAARASITVKLFDSTNTAMVAGKVSSITAEVTGPGGVKVTADDVPAAPTCSTTTTAPDGRSVTFTSEDEINHVYVCADGTSGVGTIKVYVTDLLGVKTLLSTKTVTFFGKVTKLEVAATNYKIGRAGYNTGVAEANRDGTADTPAFVIKATDSSGTPVANLASGITGVSSDTTVVSTMTATCVEDIASTANIYSSGGAGFYNCYFSTPGTATSGKTATLTARILNPADATNTTYLTAPAVTVSVGGSVAKEVMTLNKTSYAPGEEMQITITATDSSGNPVYDGAATPAGVTSSKSAIGIPTTASAYVGGKKTWGALGGVYAPAQSGAFSITADGTDAAATVLKASASVTDSNAGLLTQIDALNAKIVALNALIAKIMKKLGVK